jgi:hypothetical protein
VKKIIGVFSAFLLLASLAAGFHQLNAQEPEQPTFRVKVDMVVLGFTVLDQKNKYVNGLKPKDFKVYEDEIPQKLATFAEGSRSPMQVLDNGELRPLHQQIPTPSIPKAKPQAQMFSSCSIPVITCTAALSTRQIPSPISSVVLIVPIPSPSIRTAGI